MPGKHASASPRSFYLSLARALGAVALMVIAVLVLVNRGDGKSDRSLPIVASSPTRSTSPSPTVSSPSPTPTPTRTVLPANRVTVDVLNGTSRTGLARDTAEKIEAEGYQIGEVATQRPPIAESTLYYRPGRRAEALAFREAFPEFTVLRERSL